MLKPLLKLLDNLFIFYFNLIISHVGIPLNIRIFLSQLQQ
nr:MAG TPA: hypothetical protein [Caudoviricetes sp.]